MTFLEFDKFFDDFIQECRGMRDTKGKEYANGTSRFGNFDRLAKTLEMDRLKIAQVYVQKHLDSLNSYIKTGEVYSQERIRGRIIDIVTYMILMAGMIEDTDSPTLNYGANSILNKVEPILEWKPKVGDKVVYMGPIDNYAISGASYTVLEVDILDSVWCKSTEHNLYMWLPVRYLRPVNAAQY